MVRIIKNIHGGVILRVLKDLNPCLIIFLLYADLYDIQSREDDQRTYEANRGGHHLRISQKAKTVYGGTANLRPRNSRNNRNAANSLLLKSSSLFSVALRHVVLGLVISVFFF